MINKNFTNVQIASSDISTAHRNGKARVVEAATDQSPNHRMRPPPIVVRFTRRTTRNQILRNRKILKGKNLSITEQLTSYRANLLKKAHGLVADEKLESAWSHDGHVLIRTKQDRTLQVRSLSDLLVHSV